ncbi:MAG TPA: hypothetical protein VIV57_03630 [Anaeromyxobacter sp.]
MERAMTREDLERWEGELRPLDLREGASVSARKDALAFNADVDDARSTLLEAARRLVDAGSAGAELGPCLERTVAELSFWRRVLCAVHRADLRAADSRPEFLIRYLLS